MRYRRKATEVEARQATERQKVMMKGGRAEIWAHAGNWIVTEVETGDVTVLSDRTFRALYEPEGGTHGKENEDT